MGKVVVLISADAEWRAVRMLLPCANIGSSPYGEWFAAEIRATLVGQKIYTLAAEYEPDAGVIFMQGGWGKIAAAGSTQFALDRWNPHLLVNLGTCGGFEGEVNRGETLLVDRTVVYDIVEQMGDFEEHIAHYTTDIDLSWLGDRLPYTARRSLLVSADRDLLVEDLPLLKERYGAIAGDWESGAIAWVAMHSQARLLILKGVTDLVGPAGGEAYGNIARFHQATGEIMQRLLDELPDWVAHGLCRQA
jgi:adenosylhomocysteine nucleosidase